MTIQIVTSQSLSGAGGFGSDIGVLNIITLAGSGACACLGIVHTQAASFPIAHGNIFSDRNYGNDFSRSPAQAYLMWRTNLGDLTTPAAIPPSIITRIRFDVGTLYAEDKDAANAFLAEAFPLLTARFSDAKAAGAHLQALANLWPWY